MRSTADCRSSTSTAPSGATRALPVAKLTSALATPGWRPKTRWIRTAQEPQVIPSTSKSSWRRPAGVAAFLVVSVILRFASRPYRSVLPGGNLVALVLDRTDQVATVDRRVVVGHRHGSGRDVDAGPFDASDGLQGPLDGRLAVVTVDLGNRDGFGRHPPASSQVVSWIIPSRGIWSLTAPSRSPERGYDAMSLPAAIRRVAAGHLQCS